MRWECTCWWRVRRVEARTLRLQRNHVDRLLEKRLEEEARRRLQDTRTHKLHHLLHTSSMIRVISSGQCAEVKRTIESESSAVKVERIERVERRSPHWLRHRTGQGRADGCTCAHPSDGGDGQRAMDGERWHRAQLLEQNAQLGTRHAVPVVAVVQVEHSDAAALLRIALRTHMHMHVHMHLHLHFNYILYSTVLLSED